MDLNTSSSSSVSGGGGRIGATSSLGSGGRGGAVICKFSADMSGGAGISGV